MKTYRVVLFVLAAAVLVLGTVSTPTAQERSAEIIELPIPAFTGAKCHTGEPVDITGTFHVVQQMFYDDNGKLHFSLHKISQDVSAVGQWNDEKYKALHLVQRHGNLVCEGGSCLPTQVVWVEQVRLIGQGPDDNYLMKFTFHLTVNANGETIVYLDNSSAVCQ